MGKNTKPRNNCKTSHVTWLSNSWQKRTLAHSGEGIRNVGVRKCLDANAGVREKEGSTLFMYECYGQNGQQKWSMSSGNIRWTDFCVKGGGKDHDLVTLENCGSFLHQKTVFEQYKTKKQL